MYCLDTGSLEYIVKPDQIYGSGPTVEISSVHYKQRKDWQTQIQRHVRVTDEAAKQKEHEREEEVKVDYRLDSYRDRVIGMMFRLESMWHGLVT